MLTEQHYGHYSAARSNLIGLELGAPESLTFEYTQILGSLDELHDALDRAHLEPVDDGGVRATLYDAARDAITAMGILGDERYRLGIALVLDDLATIWQTETGTVDDRVLP